MLRTITLSFLITALLSLSEVCAQKDPGVCPSKAYHPSPRSEPFWIERHNHKISQLNKNIRVDLLMVGDSITHSWETSGSAIWNKFYSHRHAFNIGFSGDTTQNVLWRLQNGEIDGISPQLTVLMIGTNNTRWCNSTPEETAAGISAIIKEFRTRLPDSRILLLAIFPRSRYASDPLRSANDAVNKLISDYADNKAIFYLDINENFLDENGMLSETLMPDLLHPNAAGYKIWAVSMEEMVVELMKGM